MDDDTEARRSRATSFQACTILQGLSGVLDVRTLLAEESGDLIAVLQACVILQGPEGDRRAFPRVPSVRHPLSKICPLKIILTKTAQDMSTDPCRQSFAPNQLPHELGWPQWERHGPYWLFPSHSRPLLALLAQATP